MHKQKINKLIENCLDINNSLKDDFKGCITSDSTISSNNIVGSDTINNNTISGDILITLCRIYRRINDKNKQILDKYLKIILLDSDCLYYTN